MGRTAVVSLSALVMVFGWTAEAQTKRAFITGVGEYEQLEDLEKTLGDARGYAEVFENDLGYEVTLLENPDRVEFITAFDTFRASIAPGDDVAFIFSGHGWSDGAENYLVLADAEQDASEIQLTLDTVGVTRTVLENINAQKPRVTLAIIDACRDYPFASLTRSSFDKGLVRTEITEGTMVMYAAGSRQKALDRLSNEDPSPFSVFTRVLLPKLKEADRPLHVIAREVKTEVRSLAESIDHDQNPAYYDELLGDFCLSGTCREVETGAEDPDTVAFTAASANLGSEESCKALLNYVDDFPEGQHRNVARVLLAMPDCEFLVAPEAVADEETLTLLEFEFEKNFGGAGEDRFDAVAPLADGGAWLVGYSFDRDIQRQQYKGDGGGPGVYAVRVNSDGRMVATQKVMEGSFITDVVTAPAPDGGVWIAGGYRKGVIETDEQLLVLRLDGDGEIVKRKLIDSVGTVELRQGMNIEGSTIINRASAALPTPDGGVFIAGTRLARGTIPEAPELGTVSLRFPLFVQIAADGEVGAEFEFPEVADTRITAMVSGDQGGVFVAGYAREGLERTDPIESFVVELDNDGGARTALNNSLFNGQTIVDIALVPGGVAVLSYFDSNDAKTPQRVALITAYDFNSNPLWEQKVSKPGELNLSKLEAIGDGRLLALGSYSDGAGIPAKGRGMPVFRGFAMEIGDDGALLSEFTFGTGDVQAQDVERAADGSFWIAGFSDAQGSATGTRDGYVAKLNKD